MTSNTKSRCAAAGAVPHNAERRQASRAALMAAGILLTATAPQLAEAGAWTRAQGGGVLSAPLSMTRADEGFDADGERGERLEFEMLEFAPRFEYGLRDDLSIGVQPKFRSVEQETASGDTASNSGLAATDVFLRKNLWREGDAAFSVQGLVKVPVQPDENDPAALGRDQVDAELSLLYGNRIRSDAGTFFYNFDVGYRRRFKEPDDQVSAGAFAGWSVNDWTFVVSSSNSIGLDNPEFDEEQVLTAGRSFSRFEAGASISYRLTERLFVNANASTTYAGEQVGATRAYGMSAFTVW